MSETCRVTDYHSAADWVRAHSGSCTSPMAVELGFENAWRVKTTTGFAEPRPGDYLVAVEGGIQHIDTTRCGVKGCDRRGTERVDMPESWYLMCRPHADAHAAAEAAR